jgi:hypothetical protein
MVILEEPYISEMLTHYLETTQIPVLKNSFAVNSNLNNLLNLIDPNDFIRQYNTSKKIYSVSEYALEWVTQNLHDDQLNRWIGFLKNKVRFREISSNLYPDLFFREISYTHLFSYDISGMEFPFVLKPAVGFLSAGVHIISNPADWENALDEIRQNFKQLARTFPDSVVKDSTFILESYIHGKEFAIDLYFRKKEPVIINIFEHPFSSEKDVSDTLYVTSKKIFDTYLPVFTEYSRLLNQSMKIDNIPVHMELRTNGDRIVPIEINPLRFTGMCLNELLFYITGKHPLYYYFSDSAPDYKEMWKGKEDCIYSFSLIEKQPGSPDNATVPETISQLYSDILEIRYPNNPNLNILAYILSRTNEQNQQELDNILNHN